MIETTQAVLSAVERFLVEPSLSRAIVGGSIGAVAGTQWFKKWLLPVIRGSLSANFERLLTVTVAFAIGYVLTDKLGGGPILSIIVGLANPSLYSIGVKVAYHRWPWLEPKLSARPRKIVQTPEGFEERDITVPSAANEKTVLYREGE